MYKYDINYRKLALLLLPLRLRKPLVAALLYSAIQPLRDLNIRFRTLRDAAAYSLTHNGQVCYLRAAINDAFDIDERRITITDGVIVTVSAGVVVSRRDDDSPIMVSFRDDNTPVVVHRRGYTVNEGANFIVNIPVELKESIDTVKLSALIGKYKLVSKTYALNYI
ncbi:MAG: hypothetical protein SOZ00_03250 [Tidjanibacter sp.]|nr:hypothetical protein [Tidjanibacter sp.]